MTEPSQYFKGRTVQEQMNEVIGYVDTRAAEVATAAIASDVALVHQDMLDADADAQAAAASAAAAAGTLANAVKKTGEASQSIAGDIAVAGNLTGGSVTVPAPVNDTDAASKKYVDDQDALDVKITNINAYAFGLTGDQQGTGNKIIYQGSATVEGSSTHGFICKSRWIPSTGTGYNNAAPCFAFYSNDGIQLGSIEALSTGGTFQIRARVYNHDGTYKLVPLAVGDN